MGPISTVHCTVGVHLHGGIFVICFLDWDVMTEGLEVEEEEESKTFRLRHWRPPALRREPLDR